MNQREAVYTATHSVLDDASIAFEDGQAEGVATVVSEEARKSINEIICKGFQDGTVDLKPTAANQAKLANPTELRSYTSGLISNWFRKDPRFNGNTKYEAKNPGSRSGQGDAQMKNLRLLKKKYEGTDKVEAINEAIEARTLEINANKAKAVEVNWDYIPEALRTALDIEVETEAEGEVEETETE